MKASLHLGQGKSLHNDRDFDLSKSDHIDLKKQSMNQFIVCSSNPEDKELSFSEWEMKFYEENFANSLTRTNEKYIAQRHPERIKTMAEWVEKTYKPTEAIIQLGNKNDQINPVVLEKAFVETLRDIGVKYPQIKSLDVALHADETTPHIHYRFVIVGHDKEGNLKPLKTQGLKEMGIERPDLLKPEGRHNNPLMTFTAEFREILYLNVEKLGMELDREPQPESQHLDVLTYKKQQTICDIDKRTIELEQINSTLEERREELQHTEDTIKRNQQAIKSSPHVLTKREIERIERYYRTVNSITGKVAVPEQEYLSLVATKKTADNITLLKEELTTEKNKLIMAQRRLEADRDDVLNLAREEGLRQGLDDQKKVISKAECFDEVINLLKSDENLMFSFRRSFVERIHHYPRLAEALSGMFEWAENIKTKVKYAMKMQ